MGISGRSYDAKKSNWPEGGAREGIFPGELQRVAFFSLLAGASALIPVPFVDDWVWNWVRRRMAVDVIEGMKCSPGDPEVRGLFISSSRSGCLSSLVVRALVAPFRVLVYVVTKFFKKVLFVLAILDASNRASRTFHEGFLLSHVSVSGSALDQAESLRRVSEALEITLAQLDMSPIRNIFRSMFRINRSVLRRAAGILRKLRRSVQGSDAREDVDDAMRQEADLLGRLADETSAAVLGQKGYLDQVAVRFVGELESRGLTARRPGKSMEV